jgi:DUF4097 and DUF4098 domain-containing protein YvlB
VSYNTITSTSERTQAVADAKSLTVETRNGRITLIKDATATQVHVTARIKCGGADKAEADQRANDSTLSAEVQSDGMLRVNVTFAPCANGNKHYPNDGASIEIRAAALTGVNLTTSNGAIAADGFDGVLNARSSNGGIKVTGHNGAVHVDTSNGGLEILNAAGPLELETSNGAINASLASGSSQSVNMRSSNGSVKLELPSSWNGAMTAKTSNGKVTVKAETGRATNISASRGDGSATIGNGNAKVTVRTSNGGVLVTVR